MLNLKDQLIKLGSTNPELRKNIRPVLAKIAAENKLDRFLRGYRVDVMSALAKLVGSWGHGSMDDRKMLMTELDLDNKIQVHMPRHDTTFVFGLGSLAGTAQDLKLVCHVIAESGDSKVKRTRNVSLGKPNGTEAEIAMFIEDVLSKELGIKVNVF